MQYNPRQTKRYLIVFLKALPFSPTPCLLKKKSETVLIAPKTDNCSTEVGYFFVI